ncbi:MAG: ABC transporter permease [Opitutales bacterium]|nr:ABC transporter permease [Opitutales bacterium]
MSPADAREYARVARERSAAIVARAQQESGRYGAWILFRKEMDRFIKVSGQTIVSPVLTTLLWFLVFGYSLGERLQEIQGIPYVDFLVPGLIMMALIMNSFLNSGFSFFISKIHGTVTDLLVSPLSPVQILAAYSSASILRGMLVGGAIWIVAALMGASTLHNLGLTLLFMALTCFVFALLGLIIGILARDFDHVNFIPSFLIMPLTFLGGVFYSIEMLPKPWDSVSLLNPILYMVNGLRYGMTGVSDVPVYWGLLIVCSAVAACWLLAWWLLITGKKLRE